MTFAQYLDSRVCYRTLIQSMPVIGSPFQLRLLWLYENGKLPTSHPYSRQMRKLEFLTRMFRLVYDGKSLPCDFWSCPTCLENGGY